MENTNYLKFNLLEIKYEQIEILQDEGNGYKTGIFYGQPVVLRRIGQNTENVRKMFLKYANINHAMLTINYGIVLKEEADSTGELCEFIYVIRELFEGKNFYFITNFEHHNKLIVIYQIILLFEYLHSFGVYYKFLKPQKIFLYHDVKVKVLNLIQYDHFERNDIINGPLNDDIRFFCPDIFNPEVEDLDKAYIDIYNIGCHIFYAVYQQLPWKDYESKADILKSYSKGEIFINNDDGGLKSYYAEHDPAIVEIIKKCLGKQYVDINELKADFEDLPEIILYKYEGYKEFDYDTGIYFLNKRAKTYRITLIN
jgi:serine/threonine protein kinase